MLPLNEIMKKVSAKNKYVDGETTLEQICLNLTFDSTKLWLAARKENPRMDTKEIRKRVANVLIGGLIAADILKIEDIEEALLFRVNELENS